MRFSFFIITILISSFIMSDNMTIQTNSGITKGVVKNGVVTWNDIPYALPPTNDLRWRAPRSFVNLNKVIKNLDTNYCVQESSNLGGIRSDKKIVGSEDCLYLDIKAPKNLSSSSNLPVMFWIHGGGNVSGLKDIYDFSKFVKKHKVIVVTINYRLGPFGWFTHPEIQDKQKGEDKTSNFGTLDIISALKWTKNNIEKFGGDSNNITIFGESAGGHNVLSMLVSPLASGLFNKAISQSGYTTSISPSKAFIQTKDTNTSESTSSKLVDYILKGSKKKIDEINIRELLKNLNHEELFNFYLGTSNQDIPLLTSDGIAIPKIGLKNALGSKDFVYKVPTILGSNKDEVKLWLGTASYFVDIKYSFIGEILNIPKVILTDKDAFEAFNYYRSAAWQIRGVIQPAEALSSVGNKNLYLYRYDWDDHRNFLVANFKELFGAAHATEIPLITGDDGLVDEFGFLIYPEGPSKRFTSKNMMLFWKNFAYNGVPGTSSNNKKWELYSKNNDNQHYLMLLDNKKNLGMFYDGSTFEKLINELNEDIRLNQEEKCVLFFQITTYIGDDMFENFISMFDGVCERTAAENFLEENSSYIDF